jgi:hypothetical protein
MLVGGSLPASQSSVMTALAVDVEGKGIMIRIYRSGEIGAVAVFTFGRSADILLTVFVLMASFAICNGMDTGQRKAPFGVLLKQICLWLPVACYVAGLTVKTQLSLVVIGMAIGAGRAYVVEYQLFMT